MKLNKYFFLMLLTLLASGCVLLFFNSYGNEIVYQIRLPRFFQAFFTGAGLAISGAILQSTLKNYLAEPFIIGVSGGAMLMAIIAKSIGIAQYSIFFYFLICLGGFGATMLAYSLAKIKGYYSNTSILLSGIALNSFVSACIMLFVIFKKENLIYFFHFTFGNFSGLNRTEILFSSFLIFISFLVALLLRKNIDILSFDEEKAQTLGIDVSKMKFIFFAISAVSASSAVAMSGIIGFIGLVAPNLARLMAGYSSHAVIVYSAMAGAVISVVSDTIAKNIISPIEIPVGIITAFIGSPFFIWLLRKEKREE